MHLKTLVLVNRTQPNVWVPQGVVMKSWFAGWEVVDDDDDHDDDDDDDDGWW